MKKHMVFVLAVWMTLIAAASQAQATPVRNIPGLTSITFWEVTGHLISHAFGVNGSQLTTRLGDPLSSTNNDFVGTLTEFYDVFYSDANGVFNLNGAFITVEAVYSFGLPYGGGLNIAKVGLDVAGQPTEEFGNIVTSFVALGNNAIPNDAGNAADGNLNTWTGMGNTIGQPLDARLRVTIGFPSSVPSVPEPSTWLLLATGLIGLLGHKWRWCRRIQCRGNLAGSFVQ